MCELEAALLDGEIEEDRLGGFGNEKHITFLLTLVGKEITDFGNAKLSMPFFLVNKFFISSDTLVLTHALTAERVTGSTAMVKTEFTESKPSEEIVDKKVEGEDR